MFGFLKEKLKKAIKSIGDKIKKKPEERAEKPTEKAAEKFKKPVKKEKKPKEEKVEEKRGEAKEEKAEEKKPEKIKEAKKETKGFFQKLKELTKIKLNENDFEGLFEQLELTLMENNVAMSVIDSIKKKMKEDLLGKPISKKEIGDEIKNSLRNALNGVLLEPFNLISKIKKKRPFVIAFFGINGSGKTTAIAKIAHLLQKEKLNCVLAASDTFRAASIEQLQKHADKVGVKMIKHQYNADPAAVAFDAVAYAKSHAIDAVLIDTAGRMHTASNLMREMEKICKVAKPDLKIFVGEAIVGNDAVEQAKSFNDSIGIDAIVLTKADIDEKGGASISVSHVTGKPILYLGTGQNYGDLEKFNKDKIIKSLGL